MSYLVFLTAAVGAIGVYLIMPHARSAPKLGAVVALAALAGTMLIWLLPAPETYPTAYYYLFTLISGAAGVRVITHPRPVYCALYFVIVVLSSAGMLVLLAAEFMAFAMILIYGGAILVTYMFVIMLATLPQSSQEPEEAPLYDRHARQPLTAVVMGMLLLAGLSAAIFERPEDDVQVRHPAAIGTAAAADMPGKISLPELSTILQQQGVIDEDEAVFFEDDLDLVAGTVGVRTSAGTRARTVELDEDVVAAFVHNIDHIGMALFRGFPLGIELAAVVLLLAMVGAIVIARRQVPEPEPESTPG